MAKEMTRRQFAAAMSRNNFRLSGFWLKDTSGDERLSNVGFGICIYPDGRIMRRATIAKAIKNRSDFLAK